MWAGGLTHFSPCGTSRASAISWVTFARRQHAADAGLGALAELERDALDVVVRGLVAELGRVEAAVLGARAEVAAADLPDEVAAVLEVVLRQAALAGVVREAAQAPRRC